MFDQNGKRLRYIALALAGCFFVGGIGQQGQAVVNPALDFFLIDVNGEPRVVRSGEVLLVVRGDTLTINKASIKGTDREAEVVNFVGFVRPPTKVQLRPTDKEDDRKTPIDTGDGLRKKFSTDGKGQKYKIVAESSSGPYGEVFVELVDPEFRFAEVMVNGKLRVVRLGEALDLVATDKVKVRRVVTNVFDMRTVRFQIETKGGVSQMQLFRGRNVFARIDLKSPLPEPKVDPTGAPR